MKAVLEANLGMRGQGRNPVYVYMSDKSDKSESLFSESKQVGPMSQLLLNLIYTCL